MNLWKVKCHNVLKNAADSISLPPSIWIPSCSIFNFLFALSFCLPSTDLLLIHPSSWSECACSGPHVRNSVTAPTLIPVRLNGINRNSECLQSVGQNVHRNCKCANLRNLGFPAAVWLRILFLKGKVQRQRVLGLQTFRRTVMALKRRTPIIQWCKIVSLYQTCINFI